MKKVLLRLLLFLTPYTNCTETTWKNHLASAALGAVTGLGLSYLAGYVKGRYFSSPYGQREKKAIREFYKKHDIDSNTFPIIPAVNLHEIRPGAYAAHLNGTIYLSTEMWRSIQQSTKKNESLSSLNKFVLLHEFSHFDHKDGEEQTRWDMLFKSGAFPEDTLYNDVKHNIIRGQEFRADSEAFNNFSNAELYEYVQSREPYLHQIEHNSETHPKESERISLCKEILKKRETGIQELSKIAQEFFARNRNAERITKELPEILRKYYLES